jgi:hypothetical protein
MAQTQPLPSVKTIVSNRSLEGFLVCLTIQSLEEGGVLVLLALLVALGTLPVTPEGDILQTLVEPTVLQVFCRNNTVTAAAIDEVVEIDGTTGAILARPSCGYRASRVGQVVLCNKAIVWVRRKLD